jgi:hypothetical protein
MIQRSEGCLYCGHKLPDHCQEGKCKDPCLCTVFKSMTKTSSWIRLHVSKAKDKPDDGRCEYCKSKPYYELANTRGRYDLRTENWDWMCRSCRTKSEYDRGIRKPIKHTTETRAKISWAMRGNTNGYCVSVIRSRHIGIILGV